jgi:hypothetical protein
MHEGDGAKDQSVADSPNALPSKGGIALRLTLCVQFFFLVAFGVCTFFTLNTFEKLSERRSLHQSLRDTSSVWVWMC